MNFSIPRVSSKSIAMIAIGKNIPQKLRCLTLVTITGTRSSEITTLHTLTLPSRPVRSRISATPARIKNKPHIRFLFFIEISFLQV